MGFLVGFPRSATSVGARPARPAFDGVIGVGEEVPIQVLQHHCGIARPAEVFR
jgi:hypothetical protein